MARLLWPYLFLASNGFGRFEIDHDTIVRKVFVDFRNFLKLEEFHGILREFHENGLLFIYEAEDGRLWGQWDAKSGTLPRYQTAKDRKSPTPDPAAMDLWKKQCLLKAKAFTGFSEIFGKFPLGIGVGVGVGIGEKHIAQSPSAIPPIDNPIPIEGRGGELSVGKEVSPRKRFVKPTVLEVDEYSASSGPQVDGQKFCDFYESKGWMVGKNPMRDWKAAVRNWQRGMMESKQPSRQQEETTLFVPKARVADDGDDDWPEEFRAMSAGAGR